MATKAYFMIDLKKKFYQDGRIEDVVAELETIPEVKCVESIVMFCSSLPQ